MTNIIVVTGQDGVGKTTIVNRLIEIYNAKTHHFMQPKNMEDAKSDYYNFLNNMTDDTYVLDRFYEGEMIYAPLYRNYKMDYLNEIEDHIKEKYNCVFIRVIADLETILNRINVRGEDYVKPTDHSKLRDLFDDFFKNQNMPYIEIDTSTIDLEDNINTIKEYLKGKNIYGN